MRPISALEEKLLPEYPEWALRELLMNAVMHRNYDSNTPIRFYAFSDHIEIQSPGGLYGEATPENFPTRNSYRNPIIAEAMKSLGFVNRFGYGVQRAQALLAQNGNPPADRVRVRVRRAFGIGQNLPEDGMKSVAFFNNKGGVGKTSLVYHIAWMLADHGIKTLVVDFDPQANLTAMFLDEERLESMWPDDEHPNTVYGAIRPILRGTGDIAQPHVEMITDTLGLIPGDLGLSRFEDKHLGCLATLPQSRRIGFSHHDGVSSPRATRGAMGGGSGID